MKLLEFGLRYEPRGSVRGQHLVDFTVELPQMSPIDEWILHVNGVSGRMGGGVGVVLEGSGGCLLEHSLVLKFKTSNNQEEYEALVAGLELARGLGARRVKCQTNSQLVVGQMNSDFQVKDNHLLRYFHKASTLVKGFEKIEIKHIPREDNSWANMLSKLSSGREKGQLTTIIPQVVTKPSMECLITNVADDSD